MARLRTFFYDKIIPELLNSGYYTNIMAIPKIQKIVLNMGVGEAVNDRKIMTHVIRDLSAIAGQKAVPTKAKKAIAGFKIREGWPIGCKVTLRGGRMYEFLDRLISITIPTIRDFRGFSIKSFDGKGNYSIGIKEHIVFPEIRYDQIDVIRGLNITITTTANNNQKGLELLKAFDFPFKT